VSQHSKDAAERSRRAIADAVARQKRIREQRQKTYAEIRRQRGATPENNDTAKELYRRDSNERKRKRRENANRNAKAF